MRRLTCLLISMFLFSCNTDKDLGITITGWTAAPNPIAVNTDTMITLAFSMTTEEDTGPSSARTFYWTYEDDNGDLQTISTGYSGSIRIQFSTPGVKTITAQCLFDDPIYKDDQIILEIQVL